MYGFLAAAIVSLFILLKNKCNSWKEFVILVIGGALSAAQWETFEWFIAVMREILINYRDNRMGTPVVIPDYNIDDLISENKNIEIYNNILNEMIELLDKMDECNSTYNGVSLEEMHSAMNAAKDKFFELFSKYFYTLWD